MLPANEAFEQAIKQMCVNVENSVEKLYVTKTDIYYNCRMLRYDGRIGYCNLTTSVEYTKHVISLAWGKGHDWHTQSLDSSKWVISKFSQKEGN